MNCKKRFVIIVFLCLLLSLNVYANSTNISIDEMKDISSNQWFYNDVKELINLGIINGYDDNTFRPNDNVKTNEFIKMVIESLNYEVKHYKNDWDRGYIEKAIEKKIIEKGEFTDYDKKINRGEMSKIIVNCLEEKYIDNINQFIPQIMDYSKIDDVYKQTALKVYSKGIITGYTNGNFAFDKSATRAEASTVLIRMLKEDRRIEPKVNIKNISGFNFRGIDLNYTKEYVSYLIGKPDRIDKDSKGNEWYIYNSDYSKFGMILFKNNKVLGYYSNSVIGSTKGVKIGSEISDIKKHYKGNLNKNEYQITSKLAKTTMYIYDEKLLGILVVDPSVNYVTGFKNSDTSAMQKQLFDIVNAERVKNSLVKLTWSDKAVKSASKHSKDMADSNYFSHDSQNGKSPFDRMKEEGIKYLAAGENIAAGQSNIFEVHNAWINSKGHRENILSKGFDNLGNGIYIRESDGYIYYTQNFYLQTN